MKLAEALSLRADRMRRIAQLKERILRNARTQEGEAPAEDPAELLAEHQALVTEWVELVQVINRTNSATPFEPGVSLSDAIAQRDALALRRDLYRELATAATVTQERYTRHEVKFVGSVDVKSVQKQADELAKQYRQLDLRIQALNWTIDLL